MEAIFTLSREKAYRSFYLVTDFTIPSTHTRRKDGVKPPELKPKTQNLAEVKNLRSSSDSKISRAERVSKFAS